VTVLHSVHSSTDSVRGSAFLAKRRLLESSHQNPPRTPLRWRVVIGISEEGY
jgi:hypothetical protein